MKKTILAGLACIYSVSLCAQIDTKDSSEIESLEEALISAQRLGESRLNTSRQIEVLDNKQINLIQAPTMAEALSQTGLVFVQKSQMGGGSPVMRGFEASRILLVVDGVRMNNATYRAGHLQDIISIDPFMLERTELYFGSGSTLYGSDALGGAIYFKTKTPKFSDKPTVNPTVMARFASAANALSFNAGITLGAKNVAWLVNISQNNFGDLRIGKGKNYSSIDTFGQRSFFVKRVDGKDVLTKNEDPYTQVGTGYNQSDYFTKLVYRLGKFTSTFNAQFSHADEIPRYDRLTQVRNKNLRFATWNYTPQNRTFFSYTLDFKQNAEVNHRLILSNQGTKVGREVRNFGSTSELTQVDKVQMGAVNYDNLIRINKKFRIQSGLEFVHNNVKSAASIYNLDSSKMYASNETRYADSLALTNSVAIFANGVYELIPGDFIANAGIRFTYYNCQAVFTQNNFWKLNYGSAKFNNLSPVFNLGLVKKLIPNMFAKANFSTGFRNPNIDDLTKLFESNPGLKYIVPNVNLKPEKNSTADLGIQYAMAEKWNIEIGVYYSKITNLLIDQKSTLNGQDSVNYRGQMTPVFQMQNAASGFVRGMYVGGKIRIWNRLFGDAYYSSTFGRYKQNSSANSDPLDHIAPDHGRVGLRWANEKIQAELYMLFNGRKVAREYSPSGEDNSNQAPGNETPRWETYNCKVLLYPKKYLCITAGVENIMDLNYRVFSSGMSAPGRNFVTSVRLIF